jgi:hypothetical protein
MPNPAAMPIRSSPTTSNMVGARRLCGCGMGDTPQYAPGGPTHWAPPTIPPGAPGGGGGGTHIQPPAPASVLMGAAGNSGGPPLTASPDTGLSTLSPVGSTLSWSSFIALSSSGTVARIQLPTFSRPSTPEDFLSCASAIAERGPRPAMARPQSTCVHAGRTQVLPVRVEIVVPGPRRGVGTLPVADSPQSRTTVTSTHTALGATGRRQTAEAIDHRDEGTMKRRCAPRTSLRQGSSDSR